MKATLTFNLDDFEDIKEHKLALHGRDMMLALRDFNEDFLRWEIRKNPNNSPEQIEMYEKVQGKLFEYLDQYNVEYYF